jgi:hypothetical protein
MDIVEAVRIDAEWVLKSFGSDAQERAEPGSKYKAQAARIAEFVRQWLDAEALLQTNGLHMITIRPFAK